MSGFVPRRVSMTRTAMGSTDANSTGKNGHSTVSTIGRRSTLLRNIQTRSFGSMFQIKYKNAVDEGDKCTMETLVPTRNYTPLAIPKDTATTVTIFRDGFTSGFVRRSLQQALVAKHGGNTYTDNLCTFGAISNNAGDNITLAGFDAAGNPVTYGQAPGYTDVIGRRIIGIERWFNPGWSNGSGASVVIGFEKTGGAASLTTNTAPFINITNSDGVSVNNIQASDVIQPGNWGGIDIGDFDIVRYGPTGPTNIDNFFSVGITANQSKNISISFV
tara:strand:+ start:24 stop:845 length:822 start_codon:yes stop_codon:yes gene_type:complete